MESVFGTVRVGQGDNVIIPRVTIHRWIPVDVEQNGPLKAYCVEGTGHIEIPPKYLTRFGQFLACDDVLPDKVIADCGRVALVGHGSILSLRENNENCAIAL